MFRWTVYRVRKVFNWESGVTHGIAVQPQNGFACFYISEYPMSSTSRFYKRLQARYKPDHLMSHPSGLVTLTRLVVLV
ncbi:hypothetical protein EB796_009827 [Bugula neritina]|uniref:Uncharacterized protein n=1 Tax=Bugula neritina TaxID=10212 RepID=A0A7J7K1N1_BUGNE|nr:hypothetical protein EB796_009827 [Bugula neritina]